MQYESHAGDGTVKVVLDPPARNRPESIYVRIRHPKAEPLQSVLLNGKAYDKIDREKEWIILPGALTGRQEIVAHYR